MKITKSDLEDIVREIYKEEEEYKKFYEVMLKKYGVNEIDNFPSDDVKSKFLAEVDKNWKSICEKIKTRKKIKTEAAQRIKQFDNVHILPANLSGIVYKIQGDNVVVNTLKKGLVKTKLKYLKVMPGKDESVDTIVKKSIRERAVINKRKTESLSPDVAKHMGSIHKGFKKVEDDGVMVYDSPASAKKASDFLNSKKIAASFDGKYVYLESVNEANKEDLTMTALEWGKTTAERNANLDKYDSLKSHKEKQSFLQNLKDKNAKKLSSKKVAGKPGNPIQKKLMNVFKESVNEQKVYIDYLNKKKGFKQDRIKFNSYDDAVKWAKKNFDKFSPDMIKYESVNETSVRAGLKLRTYLNGRSDIVDYELVNPNYYNAVKGGKTNLFKVINSTHSKIKVGSTEDFSTDDVKAQLKAGVMTVLKESVNEATTLQKIFRKIGWGGDGWTPKDYARQIKDLPDSTLKIWYDSAKKNKGIPNTPLAFQQKLTKIEMEKRGLLETMKLKEIANLKESTDEPKIITQLRDVVKSGYKKLKDPKTGRTMTVDSYSASAIVKVYDALKDPKNKEKFSSAGLLGMQSMAFKLIK